MEVLVNQRSASNLGRKRIEASLYKAYFRTSSGRGTKPFQTSCGRGEEYHFESRAEEKKSYTVIRNSKPRADRGAEYQFVGIFKPHTEEGKNV